ncbi:MAG: bifunctional DNA-formamidopyrimidine glycosylase/DNA-(apurinic or apyrimidinic site) lyase [Patescibacteria group bacterium]
MPELPEVQTTASGLDRVLRGLVITDVWTDYDSKYFYGSDSIKDPAYFKGFKKNIIGRKIISVTRRAKNILIHLSAGKTMLIHMKMTGHMLYGNYDRKDPFNRHIRFIAKLSNGKTLEMCDTRRFAKITMLDTETMHETEHLRGIGPEPLEDSFTFSAFKERIGKKPRGKIKPVLLDQAIIAGIGNIYSDESLWRAGIHPEQPVETIPEKKLRELYAAIHTTLLRGIDLGGDSMSDYRNIDGKRGKFQEQHMAYKRTGKACQKKGCEGKIIRTVVAGRGTHFCDEHQKLNKAVKNNPRSN